MAAYLAGQIGLQIFCGLFGSPFSHFPVRDIFIVSIKPALITRCSDTFRLYTIPRSILFSSLSPARHAETIYN